MNGQKKTSPIVGRVLYGIGGLSAVTEVVFLLTFLTAADVAYINSAALLIAVAAGVALPIFFMPLFYAFINGNTAISTGRYHLVMTVAGILSPLSFVFLLAVGKAHPVGQTFALLGIIFVYSLSRQVFLYCYTAMGNRFDRSGKALKVRGAFNLGALALSSACVFMLQKGTRDEIRAVFALAAIISLLSYIIVYMTTVSSLPAFIRVEPRHKRSIGETYRRFVSPLKNKKTKLFMIATAAVSAGVAFALSAIPEKVLAYKLGGGLLYKLCVVGAAAVAAVVGGAFMRLVHKKGGKAGSVLAYVLSAVATAVTAATAVLLFVPIAEIFKKIAVAAFAVMTGAVAGALLVEQSTSGEHVAEISSCTPGRYACLRNCVAALGIACGAAFAVAADMLSAKSGGAVIATVVCVLSSLLLLAGAVVCRVAYSDGGNGPSESQADSSETSQSDSDEGEREKTGEPAPQKES